MVSGLQFRFINSILPSRAHPTPLPDYIEQIPAGLTSSLGCPWSALSIAKLPPSLSLLEVQQQGEHAWMHGCVQDCVMVTVSVYRFFLCFSAMVLYSKGLSFISLEAALKSSSHRIVFGSSNW